MQATLYYDGPLSLAEVSVAGHMTSELIRQMHSFNAYVQPTTSHKVLPLQHAHTTHTKI